MFLTENYTEEDFNFGVVNENRYEGNDEELVEAIYESELEFKNLTIKMMKLEHSAIINEDVVLLEKGIKDYWNKFINALKKLWQKIKDFFAKIWAKIKAFFQNTEKWWVKNKGKVKEALANMDDDFDGSYHTYANLTPMIIDKGVVTAVKLADSSNKQGISDFQDAIKKELGISESGSFTEVIRKRLKSEEKKNQWPSFELLNKGIHETDKAVKVVDGQFKMLKQEYKNSEKEAKAAMKSMDDKTKAGAKEEHKVAASNHKNCLSVISDFKKTYISLLKKRTNEFGKIARKALSAKTNLAINLKMKVS